MSIRFLDCGDTAFTVEFGNVIDPGINEQVMALHGAIKAARADGHLAGVVETVPTMRSLMVVYDPLRTTRAELQPALEQLLQARTGAAGAHRRVVLPCCYDDAEFAPDLQEVAERAGCTVEDVIARHTASTFRVYVLGFMPGLAYMAGLDRTLYLPRRTSPRVRVPQSTVAIAMDMSTIYPFESPGGWHLIGRTPVLLFDKRRSQPVTLQPGDDVKFERIDRARFDAIQAEVTAGRFHPAGLARAA